ncbi:S8 family serine peptidase [Bordetella ansorpii]|nr:S8 family serine peptidase [Bordetella ansorpii]
MHETNHKPIELAQRAIFDKFGARVTPSGMTYADLMATADANLSAAERALKPQVFSQAQQLALDVRDYTNKAIVNGDLVLTARDQKYAALSPAAAATQWQADIDRMFGSGPGGFDTGRQNLAAFRAETAAISASGGDPRWRVFNTQQKLDNLLATAKSKNIQLFGTTHAFPADLDAFARSRGLTTSGASASQLKAMLSSQQQNLQKISNEIDGARLARGVLSVGGKALDRAIATSDFTVNYQKARQEGQTVWQADVAAGKQFLHDAAIGLLVVGGTAALVAVGVPALTAGAIVAGVGIVGAVVDSAWEYAGAPLVRMAGSLSDADFSQALKDLEAVHAGILKWTQEEVIPFLKNVQFNAAAFASDPEGYLKALGQSVWNATRQGLSERWRAGGTMVEENISALDAAVHANLLNPLGREVHGLVQGFGDTVGELSTGVQDLTNRVSSLLDPVLATTPRNGTMLDVATDTQTMQPPNLVLGSSSAGQGLVQAGAGYAVTMPERYVNLDGMPYVSPGNVATGGTRPGNNSLNDLSGQLAGLRAHVQQTMAVESDGQIQLIKAPNSFRSDVVTFRGMQIEATVYFDAQGQWIGFTPKAGQGSITKADGTVVQLDPGVTILLGDNRVGSDGGLSAYQWVSISAESMEQALVSQQAANQSPYLDPVTLDAGNDGVSLGALPVKFDLDADGVPEYVRWTSPTDPLLVMDRNFDGRISTGAELFSLTAGAGGRPTLGSLDTNADGKLDEEDSHWSDLKVWVDRNQDAYASDGELTTLADLGIRSIDLRPVTGTVAGQAGIKGVVATYADGSRRTLWDVPLETTAAAVSSSRSTYTQDIDRVTLNGQSALVAKSLHGVRLDLNGSGATQAQGQAGNDTLIGAATNDWLIGGAGSDTFSGGAGNDLLVIDADDLQANINGGTGIDTVLIADDRGVTLNLYQANVEVVYGGYGSDVLVGGGADNYFIEGAAGNDYFRGGSADDALSGDDGDDTIYGGDGDDLIRGGRGNDQLFGGNGGDVIDGGAGDDIIDAGAGNDVISASAGRDVIDGGAGIDLIELSGALSDYRFVRTANGGYQITDSVADRDGTMVLTNVEKFSFKTGTSTTTLDFGLDAPLAVDDRISVAQAGTISVAASSLLANDLDFQHLDAAQLSISWVGDAVGGTVTLSSDRKTITFTRKPGFSGPIEFSYRVKDAQGNTAPVIANAADPSVAGQMKARVMMVPAGAPADPDYVKQWYLGAIGAPTAWNYGYTGKGIGVLVLEPGGPFAVDRQVANLNHADLVANKSAYFKDTVDHALHATQVAGVIGAARNGIGGVGVAYDVTLDAKSFIPFSNPTSTVAAFRADLMTMSYYDVVNNSWGQSNPDQFGWYAALSAGDLAITLQTEAEFTAQRTAATLGRGGLGTVMVYAAGNDRAKGYDAGLSTLATNEYTITVGGVNLIGDVGGSSQPAKPFSQRGANVLVSAPASNIVTTGLKVETPNGESIGTESSETQGTSFATPIVAGIAALMLQANAKLTYRDVQTILALTATRNMGAGANAATAWLNNGNRDWNGVGMHYSHDFGFGMVDAAAAVRMAETWVSNKEGAQYSAAVAASAEPLADMGSRVLTFAVEQHLGAEQVLLHLNVGHTRWSDLVVTLVSPSGTRSVLLDRAGLASGIRNPMGATTLDVDLMSVHFRGEDVAGQWQLIVEDKAAGNAGVGRINATLQVVGSGQGEVRRYVLTDEYSGGWTVPSQDNVSELNASAVTGAVQIDLSGVTASRVNGNAIFVNAGIDRVVGTDGNDTLTGGSGDDALVGGRGNDILKGGAGKDRLEGGQGSDTLDGGDDKDLLIGGAGDTLTGGKDADIFVIEDDGTALTTITDFSAAAGDMLAIRAETRIAFENIGQSLQAGGLMVTYSGKTGQHSVWLQGVTQALTADRLSWLSSDGTIKLNPTSGAVTSKNVIYVSAIPSIAHKKPYSKGGMLVTDHGVYFSGVLSGGALSSAQIRNVSYNPVLRQEKVDGQIVNRYEVDGEGYTLEELSRFFEIDAVKWGPQGTAGDDLMLVGTSAINPVGLSAEWARALANTPRLFSAGEGNDEVIGDDSKEIMFGGKGDDVLTGNGGDDVLSGDEGADLLYGGAGNDTLSGGDGDDMLDGGAGNDVMMGGNGDDTLRGLSGQDLMEGGNGDDILLGATTTGASAVIRDGVFMWRSLQYSTSDVSTMRGGAGNDTLTGTGLLSGDDGNDSITGSGVLDGGAGNDVLTSYGGTLIGGSGADRFVFTSGFKTSGIEDLESQDTVEFLDAAALTFTVGTTYSVIDANNFSARIALINADGRRVDFQVPYAFTVDRLAAGNIELVPANIVFQGGNRASLLLTGKSLTQSADVVVQEKLGATSFNTLGGDDIVYARVNRGLTINTGDGNDTVFALAGGDRIDAGAGNDRIEMLNGSATTAVDTLIGGAGNDTIRAGNNGAILYGDDVAGTLSGDDTLIGGAGSDTLYGGGGADVLDGGGLGNDTFYGGAGNDTLRGGTGRDIMDGGADDDVLTGGAGDDDLYGGSGIDSLQGGDGNDKLYGGDGDDTLIGGDGNDELRGDAGNDILAGGNGADTLYGGAGNDTLNGGAGNNILYGDDGDDLLNGGDYNDDLYGGAGNDTLIGGDGVNLYDGGAGNDLIIARSGVDTIRVSATSGHDTVWALSAVDTIDFTNVALSSVTFDLHHEVEGTIKWGANSLTLKDYSDNTTLRFANGVTKKLADFEPDDGIVPTDFGWVAVYDTGLIGDKTKLSAYAGTPYDDHLFGGPILASEAAYWYVVGREGNDNLAGGASGALLDGGAGDDKYLGTNGITIVRGSYQDDGQDTLVMPAGQTADTLVFSRIANPLERIDYGMGGEPPRNGLTELQWYLQQTRDPFQIGYSQGYHALNPLRAFNTLRIQSRDGKVTVDIVGYFDSGIKQADVRNVSFTSLVDDQGKPLVFDLAQIVQSKGRMVRIDPDAQMSFYGGTYSTGNAYQNYALNQLFNLDKSRDSSMVSGSEAGEYIEGRISYTYTNKKQLPPDSPYYYYNYGQSQFDLTASAGVNGYLPGDMIQQNTTLYSIGLADVLLGHGGNDVLWGGGAYVDRRNLYTGTYERDSSASAPNQTWSSGMGTSQTLFGMNGSSQLIGATAADAYLLRDFLNGGDGDDTYIYRRGDGGMTVMRLSGDVYAGARGTDRLVMEGYKSSDVNIIYGTGGAGAIIITGKVPGYLAADVTVQAGANGEWQVDFIQFDDVTINVRAAAPVFAAAPASGDMPADTRNLEAGLRESDVQIGTANADTFVLTGYAYARGREGADSYVFNRDTIDFAVVRMDKGDTVYELTSPTSGLTRYNALNLMTRPDSRQLTSIGYLDPTRIVDGRFTLDAWVPVSAGNDLGTDLLVTFQTTLPDGSIRNSYLVLADVMNPTTGVFYDPMLAERYSTTLAPNPSWENGGFGVRTTYATMGNDTIQGASQTGNVIYGRGGNDTISAGVLSRVEFYGGTGNDRLTGGSYDDILDGGDGDDILSGGAGDDTLISGKGVDTLIGGVGDDLYVLDVSDGLGSGTRLFEGVDQGNDTIRAPFDVDLKDYPNFENVELTGSQAFTAIGTDVANRLAGNGMGSTLIGHAGDDVYVVLGPDAVIEQAGEGYDRIETGLSVLQLAANVEVLVSLGKGLIMAGNELDNEIYGDAGDNMMRGLAGNDLLSGGDGDDTLDGGKGNDVLYGGGGNDTYLLRRGDGQDIIVNGLERRRTAKAGTLVLDNDVGSRQLWFRRAGNDLVVQVLGASDSVTVKDWYVQKSFQLERVRAGDGVDLYQIDVLAQAMAAYQAANPGFDTATATEIPNVSALNTALANAAVAVPEPIVLPPSGTPVADTMTGGAGDDIFYVDHAGDKINEKTDEGIDTVYLSLSTYYSTPWNVERVRILNPNGASVQAGTGLTSIVYAGDGDDVISGYSGFVSYEYAKSAVRVELDDYYTNTDTTGGSGRDIIQNIPNIIGSGYNDTIIGDSKANIIDGAGGADRMEGGAGDDTYYVDNAGDVVIEDAGQGNDTVYSYIGRYTLGANVENGYIMHPGAANMTGNALDNVIYASAGDNVIDGGLGKDTVSYQGMGSSVTVSLDAQAVQDTGGSGWDRLLGIENLTGSAYNDVLTGNAGANVLDGGAGADRMTGGAGDDTYYVDSAGDIVVELAGQGTDFVLTTLASYTLGANVENLRLLAAGPANGYGNALNNVFYAGQGANVLDGAGGVDTVSYQYVTSKVVVDLSKTGPQATKSGGQDTLISIENVTGSNSADTLTGTDGDNIIDGGGSWDTMSGGLGNDTYYVDNISDKIIENAGGGIDTVITTVGYSLTFLYQVENITAIGLAAINISGNGMANRMVGNAAANVIDGEGGADIMIGGDGNDTYVVDDAGDIIIELADEGTDTVNTTASSYTLSDNIENIRIVATGAAAVTGNALANLIFAGSGDNVMDGGGGTDTVNYLSATAGITLNLSLTTAQATGGSGTDTVRNIENVTGTRFDDVLTGNAANNVLIGGLGNDTLSGGAGNDILTGALGNDTYLLNRGDGSDVINDLDISPGNLDVARFGAGIAADQLWFSKVDDDLQISIIGTSDTFTVSNWYLSGNYHIEQFRTQAGQVLLDTDVQNLVTAMAAFSPPAAGQTAMPQAYRTALAPVIAANWH